MHFLDVRSQEEVSSISIGLKNYSNIEVKNIPINKVPEMLNNIPTNKYIGIFCPGIIRSSIIYGYLLSKGYSNISIIEGGYAVFTEVFKPSKILKT